MADHGSKRWAAVLGVCVPGLGHVVRGRPGRGGVWWASCHGVGWAWLATVYGLLHEPEVLLGTALVVVGVWGLAVWDGVAVGPGRRRPGWRGCAGLVVAHVLVGVAVLLPPGWSVVPTTFDLIARYPTDQNAVSGAGGLTVGVSRSGVVTLVRWPGPAGRDHLDWRAVPGQRPGVGADARQGAFVGLELDGERVWCRDARFRTWQRYASDTDDVVVTTHRSETLGVEVREVLGVHPERDVWVWRVEVERLAGGPERAGVVWHVNLAPCTQRTPYLPLDDWAWDHRNDFVAAYHAGDDVVVHGRPLEGGALPERPADVDAWVDGLGETLGSGVYFALGVEGGASSCSVDRDAGAPGSGSAGVFAAGGAVVTLRKEVALDQPVGVATLLVGAGSRPGAARGLVEGARALGGARLLAEQQVAGASWLGAARLPATDDEAVLRLARRSLLVLRNASDRRAGSIVASVAGQLPYALDWARDGAFLNLALDEAGFPEVVTRHNAYYVGVQRTEGVWAGTVPMNTYEDGAPGGPIWLEIDNAALLVWTLATHAEVMEGAEARAYALSVGEAIERGAEFLVRWRDPWSGLPLPAHEDDNPVPRRGIQGAVTGVLALESAARFARGYGAEALAARWEGRAEELRAAALAAFWDEGEGRLVDGGPKELDASAWALWPCRLFPADDPRAEAQAAYLWSELGRTLRGEKPRSSYDAKLVLALAEVWGEGDPRRAELIEAYRVLAARLPTPDTGVLGEHARVVGGGGAVRFETLNDAPHVWEHALHYLAALRLFPPTSDTVSPH